jgi:uridine phosphorylase
MVAGGLPCSHAPPGQGPRRTIAGAATSPGSPRSLERARCFPTGRVTAPGVGPEVNLSGFPNFSDKHGFESIVSPHQAVAAVRDNPDTVIPDAAILTYGRTMMSYVTENRGARPIEGYPGPWYRLHLVERNGVRVGVVGDFGIGAPAAAMVLEELAAMGVRRFLSVGVAGGLRADAAFGQLVLCTEAIRDEGVSHHYVPGAKHAYPSSRLTEKFAAALDAYGAIHSRGPTWTIDAPFRETLEEARSYRAEGVLTVEMEAVALFAVGRYRGVEVASAFVVSDTLLAEGKWSFAFGAAVVQEGKRTLMDAALATFVD